MTEVAARQGACHGIRVNAVAPVAGTNALQAAWSGSQAQNIAASFKPEFNAPMVMMLCSEEAKGFSGVLFEIGCGWHVATRLCKAEVAHLESCTDKSPSSILRGFQYPLAIETIKARQTQDFAHTEYKFGTKDVILYSTRTLPLRRGLGLSTNDNNRSCGRRQSIGTEICIRRFRNISSYPDICNDPLLLKSSHFSSWKLTFGITKHQIISRRALP